MDGNNLDVASTYINNLLLSRGLLKNGTNINFAHPERSDGGIEGTMAKVMGMVNDLILRRDRDASQRESLTSTLLTLRSDSQHTVTELERLTTKFGDATRKLGLADATERSLKIQLRSAEAAAKGLKEDMARMRSLVQQTRASCANEVRKRERTIEGLKKHVGEGGRARGSGKAVGVATVTVNAGIGGSETANRSEGVGEGYDLRSETNEFLTELASGLSEDNEKLGALLRRTVDSLKALSGWEREGQQEGGLIVSTEEGCEAVAAEADNVIEHLRTLLTNPSFVPLEEVELREEEIFRLRHGWERMESRWKDAMRMMDGWRKRMAQTGQTINLEELRMGMSLSPVKEGDEEEEENRDTNDLEEGYEEGDTQADIDAMNDDEVSQGDDIDEMSYASSFEEDEGGDLLQPQDGADEEMQVEDIDNAGEEDNLGDEADFEQERIRIREEERDRLRLEEEASRRARRAVEEAKEAEEAERLRQLAKAKQDEEDALMKSQRQERRIAKQAKEAEDAKSAYEAAAAKTESARAAKESTEAKKRQQREEEDLVHKQEQEKRKARQAREAQEAKSARDASAIKRRQAQASEPPKEPESRKKRKSAGSIEDESAKKRVASQEKVQPNLRSVSVAQKSKTSAVSNDELEADTLRSSTRSTRSTSTAQKKQLPSSSPLPEPPKLSPLRQPKAASLEARKVEPNQKESATSSIAEENVPELASLPLKPRFSASQQAMQFSPIKPSSLSREYHPSPILEAPSLAPPQSTRPSTRKTREEAKPWDEKVAFSPTKQSATNSSSASKLLGTLSPSKRLAQPREAPPQQSPLTMASIAAKLAATEREADAARVRAKLKAAKASRGASRAASATTTTTTKVPIKTGETPAKAEKEAETEGTERKRKLTSRAHRSNRRRSTLSPWELESLILGGVQESPSK